MEGRGRARRLIVVHYYRLTIQYKGTRYSGWQVQPVAMGETIQGKLNRALSVVSKSPEVRSLGAGRTDAGVHALGQVAKVAIPLQINPDNLVKALNVNLPDDIRVIAAETSDAEFMPTVHAKSKEYQYRFTFEKGFTAFQNDLIVNHPFNLDLEKMRKACKVFIGKHDFCNFYTEGTEVSSTVREILECEILEVPQEGWGMLPRHYVFRVVGTGFLKQMVRLMVGAVWSAGRDKISLADLEAGLGPVKRERLGPVAPPSGLYMVRVNY